MTTVFTPINAPRRETFSKRGWFLKSCKWVFCLIQEFFSKCMMQNTTVNDYWWAWTLIEVVISISHHCTKQSLKINKIEKNIYIYLWFIDDLVGENLREGVRLFGVNTVCLSYIWRYHIMWSKPFNICIEVQCEKMTGTVYIDINADKSWKCMIWRSKHSQISKQLFLLQV